MEMTRTNYSDNNNETNSDYVLPPSNNINTTNVAPESSDSTLALSPASVSRERISTAIPGTVLTRRLPQIPQLLRRNNYDRVGTATIDDVNDYEVPDVSSRAIGQSIGDNDGQSSDINNGQRRRRVTAVIARSGELVAGIVARGRSNVNVSGRNDAAPERSRLTMLSNDQYVDDDHATAATNGNSSENTSVTAERPFDDANSTDPSLADDCIEHLKLTILDFMHQKFHVSVPVNGTVLDLKRCGQNVHKVPVSRQRLIYRGQLLSDESTLVASNITTDGVIVHLFPKPRVVVRNESTTTPAGPDNMGSNNNDIDVARTDSINGSNTASGARIPTIVLNADEAERRSQILVLGSPDYLEAQNNVKLFSFMLLIISSIELLNLLAIAMGVPQQQNAAAGASPDGSSYNGGTWTDNIDDDVIFPPSFEGNSNNHSSTFGDGGTNSSGSPYDPTGIDPAAAMIYQTWSSLSYIDLLVSVAGVYVACLGIKASSDNQLRVAKIYMYGTCLTALGWLTYNYIISLKVDLAIQAEEQQAQDRYNNDHDMNQNSSSSTSDTNNVDDDWNQYNNGRGYRTVMSDDDVYNQAFQVMVLPAMVWMLCIFRAYQFSSLLQEAELEAQNRIRDELRLVDDDYDYDTGSNRTNNGSNPGAMLGGRAGVPNNDEEAPYGNYASSTSGLTGGGEANSADALRSGAESNRRGNQQQHRHPGMPLSLVPSSLAPAPQQLQTTELTLQNPITAAFT